jgi:dienelactone hydrolase
MKEGKMKKCLCVTLLVLLAFVSLGFAADKSNFTFGVTFGPHPVGFRVVHQYDYSRVYKPAFDLEGKPTKGERARPIQTLIWYPAQPDKSAQPMLYGRYVELLATEQDFDGNKAQKAATLQYALEYQDLMGKYDIERVQATHALSEAKPASGSFPVVIYAPCLNGPAFENSDLCEYLASHGYIVVASPNMGLRMRSMTMDVVGIQTQAADIEFLIGYLRNIPQADTSQIAVTGFSWGGISNVFAQVQDDRITVLVCIDGTIRAGWLVEDFLKEAKYVTASRVTVPLLFLASGSPAFNAFSYDMSAKFLNDIKYSDFQIVLFNGMEHQDFSSLSIRFYPDEHFTAYTALEVSESHSWMARYVLNFLNAYLKNDGTAREFLKNSPEKNGAPRHQLVMQSRPALHPAPTVAEFARELAKQGFDKAIPIWQEAKKKDPGFILPEKEVDALGYRLMRSGTLNEAIAVFKLNVAMYPEGYNTYDSLAEAQAAAGDKQGAIANYKKSLELNSGNTNAVNRLKKLESNPIK